MSKCTERGCRNLEWKCADCGRVASTAVMPNFIELSDQFWEKQVTKSDLGNWEEENGALKILQKFANWLDARNEKSV